MFNIYSLTRQLWWGPGECGYGDRSAACVVSRDQVDSDPMRYSNGIDTVAVPVGGVIEEAYIPQPEEKAGNPEGTTIYCFNNGGYLGWMQAVAICEDGHVVAEHTCSADGFMKHDLGITSDWKHDQYDKHCGPGNWRLEWVDNPKEHEGLQKALKLNEALKQSTEQ